ncbi:hypothetical protein OUZ56_012382 [Daphnia magna]|uniref:Uncharacterized protein n=1 Tax=Daphnia magna TaxID=35525 RepID=A0ABQ9Z2T9_9CRUS|nr:hypothetical protein OUZ56_012382 [Daphnia magna]
MQKTFANTSKKNPKDDDIPAAEQDDEDAKKVNRQLFISEKILHTNEATDDKELQMSAVIAGIRHHEKKQDNTIQLLEQKLSEALSELECTNKKPGSSQENDVTIAVADQYKKEDQHQVNVIQYHEIQEYDSQIDIPVENRIGIEVLVGAETTVLITPSRHRIYQRPPYRNGFNGRQGNYNGPNFPSNNNYRHQVR